MIWNYFYIIMENIEYDQFDFIERNDFDMNLLKIQFFINSNGNILILFHFIILGNEIFGNNIQIIIHILKLFMNIFGNYKLNEFQYLIEHIHFHSEIFFINQISISISNKMNFSMKIIRIFLSKNFQINQ